MAVNPGHTGRTGNNRGVITVYFCLILTGCFLLAGVLTDAVRILHGYSRVNMALESSVRSVLACYDRELISGSGIFALNAKDPEIQKLFIKYLKANLATKGSFARYTVDETETRIQGYEWLTKDDVLKSQIMEYMKYRVPLSAAKSIIDKFDELNLNEKHAVAQKAGELRKERTDVIGVVDSLNSRIRSLNSTQSINAENCGGLGQQLSGLEGEARHAESEVRNYLNMAEQHGPWEGEIARKEFEGTLSDFERLYKDIGDNLKKISSLEQELWKSAADRDGRGKERDDGNYDKDDPDGNDKNKQDSNGEYDPEYKPEDEPEPEYAFTRLTEIYRNAPANSETTPSADDSGAKALELLNRFYDLYRQYLAGVDPEWLIDPDDIRKNDELDENVSLELGTTPRYSNADAEAANDGVLSFARKLVDRIKASVQNGIENVYVNEYIMTHFSFVTSKKHFGHFFEKGEVEYILFGSRNQVDNVARMAQRLAFTRFAINSLDYFIASKNPEPIYRLAYALARGAIQAGRDMLDLYRGKAVAIAPSLSASTALKMDYADYLRLFLLIQPEGEKLAGIRQLLQFNMKQHDSRFNIADYSSAVVAKARVKINLWFIPAVFPDRVKIGPFEDGCYVIEKQVFLGY